MNIKAANIATTTPTIPGLIPSKPLIPLIPAAIEFDWTAFPINPNARIIVTAKNPANPLASPPVFFKPSEI